MMQTRYMALVALLLLVVAGCSREAKTPIAEDRIEVLAREIEKDRKASSETVENYSPETKGGIDDLAAPAADRRPPCRHQAA